MSENIYTPGRVLFGPNENNSIRGTYYRVISAEEAFKIAINNGGFLSLYNAVHSRDFPGELVFYYDPIKRVLDFQTSKTLDSKEMCFIVESPENELNGLEERLTSLKEFLASQKD